MKEHIKRYATEADFVANGAKDLDLDNPFVAYVDDYNGSGSTTHFKTDYVWAEKTLANQYESLLLTLWGKITELEKGGSGTYLSEKEYDKLVQGLPAYDLYGNLIETAWDDITVTYYVYEDENDYSGSTENTDSYVSDIIGNDAIIKNVTIEDGYIKLKGGYINEDGYVVFTEHHNGPIDNNVALDGDYVDLGSTYELTEDGYIVIPNGKIDNNMIKI